MSEDPTPAGSESAGDDATDREFEGDADPAENGAGEDVADTGGDAAGAKGDATDAGDGVDETGTDDGGSETPTSSRDVDLPEDVPDDVAEYERFTKMDRADYDRVNEFLRERTYITAREWAIARLCADFRTETGVEMTKIGQNLPRLVPFMTDTYTPQAVNQARASFEEKVTKAGATFLYGAMSGFYTAEELDETMYEVTEIAKFLLEVEGVDLSVEEELEAEDEISRVMREVREASAEVRGEEVKCPECGHVHETE
jgi:lysyl-tRNA synthetase class I